MKVWCLNPQNGGAKISPNIQKMMIERAGIYASTCAWCQKFQLKIRFRSQFCYLDASEGGKEAFPIGRLRYFGPDRWTLAFYTYSNERYEPCFFKNGQWYGTIEQAIEVCSVYLIN